MSERDPDPSREGFGEATPGEAQASDPPADPEMLEQPSEGEPGGGQSGTPEELTGGLGERGAGDESYGGDQDAEPTAAPDEVPADAERDQAEG